MTNIRSIHLAIGNALPNGNPAESASILALWQDIQMYFRKRAFTVALPERSTPRTWQITLDAGYLIALMEQALHSAGSFDAWRQKSASRAEKPSAASLLIEIGSEAGAPNELAAYEIATIFLQQLVIAANLVQPGALRILQPAFKSDGGHRYEAQTFDSKVYYGAFRNLRDLGWWQRHNPNFDRVWQWLERIESSHDHVALGSTEKVLFTMLKVAEQRNELSSRAALLVVYQLEMLLDCRSPLDVRHLRNRLRLVLGSVPEAADCIGQLYEVRDGFLLGGRPVQRPPLICHDGVTEFMEHMDLHDNPVELGTALVLVLLRELISHDAQAFAFSESLEFRSVQPR
ncbi:MAG: hypothetical protein SV422_04845 [Pseudomonadota bacterium]|nr:hypothetical protein [Pseudomonadota bacterium]